MIRYTLLTIAFAVLTVYAWRDWYKALCALVLLMAFEENREMPTALLGVPGLNPWNLLLASVILSWLAHRRVEDLRFDLPKGYGLLLSCYALVILVSFWRCVTDMGGIIELHEATGAPPPSVKTLLLDDLINAYKWAIPGLLLFTGARSRERQHFAMLTMIGVSVLLGLQIIRVMPLGLLANGEALSDRAIRVFDRDIGYHRVDLAALTAGGFWAIMNYRQVVESKWGKLALLGGALAVLLALALTGGRTGYGTWALLGVFFAMKRSKKYLVLGPLVAALVLMLVPAAQERMLHGFDETEAEAESTIERFEAPNLVWHGIDFSAVTSGRALAWPYVIERIKERPWVGHGQEAMQRLGITLQVMTEYGKGQTFPHPHNAYLQLMLDNGIIGTVPVLLFYYLIVRGALRALKDREHRFEGVVAATALSFIGAQLVASIGSQSFYPKSGTVVMFVAIGLQLRMMVQRAAREAEVKAGQSPPSQGWARRRPSAARAIQGNARV